MSALKNNHIYDLLIIGGGINGAGIARDASGRGLSVGLVEQNDLASATSSASTKLIHGGLRYLEYGAFRLVRKALKERETLWSIAPHIIWPMRFVLPHHKDLRSKWMIKAGLFLYDHLGGREALPKSTILDLTKERAGNALHNHFSTGFEYSDCWVEDSRLVILNALDAARHGADIAPYTRFTHGERKGILWHCRLKDMHSGITHHCNARMIVNASGPWASRLIQPAFHEKPPATMRLVRGSHIIIPKIYQHDRAYLFQQKDGRVIFAIPYEKTFTLIGTTEVELGQQCDPSDPHAHSANDEEITYLCEAASNYFKKKISSEDIIGSFAGIRPLIDSERHETKAASRDYKLFLQTDEDDRLPLLSVYGGKITSYRTLAEKVLKKLEPYAPPMKKPWTARSPLPGGDFDKEDFKGLVSRLLAHYRFMTYDHGWRLARAYGTLAFDIMGDAKMMEDLGPCFGGDFTARELDYLIRHEWAHHAEDVLWRRSKLQLHLSEESQRRIAQVMA